MAKLQGTRRFTTDRAVSFNVISVNGTELETPETMWIPLSQVHSSKIDPKTEGEDLLDVSDWIAKQKGLL